MSSIKSVQFIIAAVVVFGFFFILGLMLFRAVPQENQAILNVMLGALGTMMTQIIMFFFGSTQGSKDKDKAIQDALNSTPLTATPLTDAKDVNIKADGDVNVSSS